LCGSGVKGTVESRGTVRTLWRAGSVSDRRKPGFTTEAQRTQRKTKAGVCSNRSSVFSLCGLCASVVNSSSVWPPVAHAPILALMPAHAFARSPTAAPSPSRGRRRESPASPGHPGMSDWPRAALQPGDEVRHLVRETGVVPRSPGPATHTCPCTVLAAVVGDVDALPPRICLVLVVEHLRRCRSCRSHARLASSPLIFERVQAPCAPRVAHALEFSQPTRFREPAHELQASSMPTSDLP